jgi:hypothetical protein
LVSRMGNEEQKFLSRKERKRPGSLVQTLRWSCAWEGLTREHPDLPMCVC